VPGGLEMITTPKIGRRELRQEAIRFTEILRVKLGRGGLFRKV